MKYFVKDLEKILNAKKINLVDNKEITGIAIDSRKVKEGDLFIPFLGENVDGHDYIESAFEKGAVASLSLKDDFESDNNIIYVNNSYEAIQTLAKHYLECLNVKIVAITGSNGKTTTKDIVTSILETKFNSQNIYIKNDQDIQLRGILIPKEKPQMTVLISHPFGLQAKDMQLYVPYFEDHLPEAQILLIDACAHGQSDGYIRGFGIKDVNDLVCWNKYLLETYGKDHKILMYGKEQGANTILNASGRHVLKNVEAIISDGAYTSPYDIIGYRLEADYKISKYPAISIIARHIKKAVHIDLKENTTKYVRHNDIPTLYFHAKDDDFVPLKMVYPLYNKNRGEKVLFVLKDEKYLYELVENDDFKQTLSQFIKKYMK